MKLDTYLSFDGDCRAAFAFYARVLGGKVAAMMTFGEANACGDLGEAARDLVMHARLDLDGFALMGTDATPQYPYQPIQGAHVVVNVDEPAEAERIFAALAEGGRVDMPMQETFWARRYGIAVDRHGVPWMVNCAQPAFAH